jgi:outer membrane lipoprotein-sorting protein
MTRKVLAVGIAGFVALAGVRAAAQQAPLTVDDIVAKNIAAKGGLAKMKSVQTMKQTSHMSMQGMEATLTIFSKRPNLIRQEIQMRGQTVVMAFDGVAPWTLNPFNGSSGAVLLTGPQADMVKDQSSFDGPLSDYKEKGSKLELVGIEPLGATKVVHLKLTTKTGSVQHVYLDAATYLEAKLVADDMGKVEQELGDYRDVNGFKVPFRIKVMQNGVLQSELIVDKVEFNIAMDDGMFRLPK